MTVMRATRESEAAPREPTPAGRARGITSLPAHRARLAGGAFGLYLGVALAFHHRVLPHFTERATGWVSSDSSLFVWWLHWVPWALTHGQNPLYTTFIGAPGGANGMWNTSVPALGLLLSPITFTAGPVAAFNTGMILGPAVCAVACYAVLGPYVTSWPARVVGGGLYGFAPFAVAHAAVGHLNLVWGVLPPLIAWAVRALLVEQRHPVRDGALFGVALALSLGLYTQTVALGALALALTAAVLAAARPSEVAVRIRPALRALLSAAAVVVAACAYPLWLVLLGPSRPHGQIRDPAVSGADLASLVAPSPLVRWHPALGDLGRTLFDALPSEAGSYIGIPLLAVAVATAVLVQSLAVRVVALVGVLLCGLSLGGNPRLAGTDIAWWSPWQVLHDVPLLGQAEPVRLALFVAFCVAFLTAVALDRAIRDRRWVLVGLLLLGALTWMPSNSQQTTDARSPAFFTAGAPGLSPSDIVVTVPRASGDWVGGARPMLWQSAAGMGYRQVGGYFIGSAPQHPLVFEAPATAYDRLAGDPGAARRELDALGVTVVLVVEQPDVGLPDVLRWTQQVTGTPGVTSGGVWVFRR